MRKLFLPLIVLALFGCAAADQPTETPDLSSSAGTATACEAPRRVVVASDRSGSYDSQPVALNKLAEFVERATCPGDELLVRWISEDSFVPAAATFSAVLPLAGPPPPTPANPFARRQYEVARAEWQAMSGQLITARHEVAQAIRDLAPDKAPASDIHGFFAKAGELLAGAPSGHGRLVVVASDLEDTVGREVPFDLTGAAVLVICQSSAHR